MEAQNVQQSAEEIDCAHEACEGVAIDGVSEDEKGNGTKVRAESIPTLTKKGDRTLLLVDGKPFFMLGGELGNSSASDQAYVDPIWPKLQAMHVNTLLAPVYWELIEPEQGRFDFESLEWLIEGARKEDLRLVLLWFGSWKNSMSSYVPSWVKRDSKTFPRARSKEGFAQEILTPFDERNLEADKRAFLRLMGFVREFDGEQRTVIMVQVDNDLGLLPIGRD
jgi:beta-galactosidase GanA